MGILQQKAGFLYPNQREPVAVLNRDGKVWYQMATQKRPLYIAANVASA
jgi:hypothetical protein